MHELQGGPVTFRHFVSMQRHPVNPFKRRECCICGYRSPWRVAGRAGGHPHMVVTVSMSDLTPMDSAVQVQAVSSLADGTWIVTYKCGHLVYGTSGFDRAKAMTNHSVFVCHQQPAPADGTGLQSDTSGAPATGRPQSTQQEKHTSD